MSKIKVLHAADILGIGGSEKTLQILCKYLDKSKFDVYVCGRHGGGVRAAEIEKYGIPVYLKPDNIDSLVQELKIDIYHAHRSGHYDPGSLPRKKLPGLKIVETNVFGELDIVENYLIDCHIFVSEWCLKKYLERHCQFHNKLYKVLYNPVDFEEFKEEYDRPFHNTYGRLSRADDQKWHDVCLKIIPRVIKKIPDARCHLMGVTERIHRMIQSMGVMDSVVVHENSLDVALFYQQVDVFTHASRVGESFGCVIAEAMANRVPVVTLRLPERKNNAHVELVDHKVNGFVCRTQSQYASAVIELLQNHPLRERFGEQAYQKARDCFDARKIVSRLQSLYTELMDTKF